MRMRKNRHRSKENGNRTGTEVPDFGINPHESSREMLASAFSIGSRPSAVAPGAVVDSRAYLGNWVTIYPRVHLGSETTVMDGVVLGRPPIPNATVTRPVRTEFLDLAIGAGTIIGCNSVIYTGTRIGKRVLIGDLASIREGCSIGDDVIIGRGVMVLYNCQIGARSRIQDQAHLVGNMIIEEDVFIGMGVTSTNDDEVYVNRFGHSKLNLQGPTIRRFAVIGAGATLLPGVEIGTGAMVAAGAVVARDILPWTVAAGVPAQYLRDISPDWIQVVKERMEQLRP